MQIKALDTVLQLCSVPKLAPNVSVPSRCSSEYETGLIMFTRHLNDTKGILHAMKAPLWSTVLQKRSNPWLSCFSCISTTQEQNNVLCCCSISTEGSNHRDVCASALLAAALATASLSTTLTSLILTLIFATELPFFMVRKFGGVR